MALAVCVGMKHSAAIDSDGRVWTWGAPGPWLGHGSGKSKKRSGKKKGRGRDRPQDGDLGAVAKSLWAPSGGGQDMAASAEDAVAVVGSSNGPILARRIYHPDMDSRNVVSVAAGDTHTVAATRDGVVFVWGTGESGSLGLGTDSQLVGRPTRVPGVVRIASVAAGPSHSIALTALSTPSIVKPRAPTLQEMEAERDEVRRAVRQVRFEELAGVFGAAAAEAWLQ